MKKLISLLLCMVLLAAVPVLAAQGDLIITRSDDGQGVLGEGIRSSCGMGDSLYMILEDGKTLVAQKAGESEPKSYAIQIGPDTENPMNGYTNYLLLNGGDALLALRMDYDYSGETTAVQSAMYKITLDGESASAEELYPIDWSTVMDNPGDVYLDTYASTGAWMVLRTYGDNGTSLFRRMNLADGTAQDCALGDLQSTVLSVTSYTEGRVLITAYTDEQRNRIAFIAYDPAADAAQTLCEADVEQYVSYAGIATDMDSGKTYFTRAGEIFEIDPATGTVGESVSDMPLDYTDSPASILTGGFYACSQYSAYVLRNVNAAGERGTRLKVYDNSYADTVTDAFYQFSNEHGEVFAVLSREYNDASSLVDDMMNRSADVDVYIMQTSTSAFEAVRTRGYIADVGGSETIDQLSGRLYDAIREQLSVNGKLAMLPVDETFWLPYVDAAALEKLGLTAADVPANWSDMLDFIANLADRLPADGSVRLLDPYTTDTGARWSLFSMIFQCYQQTLNADPNAVSAQEMTEILRKLEQIDFAALGQPTDEDVQRDDYTPDYNDNECLLQLNMGMSLRGITKNQLPLVMALTPNTPRYLNVDGTVAFINPFSEHQDLALEFMETLAQNMDDAKLATYCQDVTEPVENPNYEQGLASAKDWVDQCKKQLENCEEVDRQSYEEQLANAQQNLDSYEADNFYSISQDDLNWIHENAQYFVYSCPNWLYDSGDDGSSGDAFDLVQQYVDGKITADKLMQEVDRKVRMRMMEGY